MLSKEPLNEQEKRFLGALKLFMEADPKHAEAGKILDEMPPDAQRAMINAYHLGLDDPRALAVAIWLQPWLSPILTPFFWVQELLDKMFRRRKP